MDGLLKRQMALTEKTYKASSPPWKWASGALQELWKHRTAGLSFLLSLLKEKDYFYFSP